LLVGWGAEGATAATGALPLLDIPSTRDAPVALTMFCASRCVICAVSRLLMDVITSPGCKPALLAFPPGVTFDIARLARKSHPPTRRKPQGLPPVRLTVLSDILVPSWNQLIQIITYNKSQNHDLVMLSAKEIAVTILLV